VPKLDKNSKIIKWKSGWPWLEPKLDKNSKINKNLGNTDLSNLGTCQCFPEYTGSACDIKIADPPILSSIFGGATCDVYLDDCTAFTVLGLNFLDEDTLTCHYMLENGVSSIVIPLTFSMPVECYSFDF
jgi:hypothetical protein